MNSFSAAKAFSMREGSPYPLGAHCRNGGVNFAIFSANAKSVELCLFDERGAEEIARILMPGYTDQVWHCFIEGIGSGTRYGFRVHGVFDPRTGHRFNPHKLLLDPYARMVDRPFQWSDPLYGYEDNNPLADLSMDSRDSAPEMPKCVVVSEQDMALTDIPEPRDNKPRLHRNELVIYETHVKGFTRLHNAVAEHERGTYAGIANPDVLAYIKGLGVTAIELLPVHGFVDEHFIVKHGLSNYWGYNTLLFFAPHAAYSASGHPVEFKRMVSAIHEAGMEVILDVVYNHTAEGNNMGPTLCFRGIDNASYYTLQNHDPRYYANDTGCGNTLNLKHPRVLQMVMDSLRFWANDMGVDGFRFDLATVLGRESYGFDPGAGFFDALRQDPSLAQVKLIAEPWDIGPGGYQLGNYPNGWCEWNDRYRDTCRRFWKGDQGVLPEFARRIHGSSDLFEHSGRAPAASINFITSHDGFTLNDVVCYKDKHNEDNKEQNRDGHHTNFSDNYGAEGPTDDLAIRTVRERQKRNLLATLILSQGTPMILAGDEFGRTQRGNNNAYCQDNELNWLNWQQIDEHDQLLQQFVTRVIEIRKAHPLLTSKQYIHRPDEPETDIKCVVRWVTSSGEEMRDNMWTDPQVKTLGWILEQYPVEKVATTGCKERILILFNASDQDTDFCVPIGTPDAKGIEAQYWYWLLDTYEMTGIPKIPLMPKGAILRLYARSLQVLVAKFKN